GFTHKARLFGPESLESGCCRYLADLTTWYVVFDPFEELDHGNDVIDKGLLYISNFCLVLPCLEGCYIAESFDLVDLGREDGVNRGVDPVGVKHHGGLVGYLPDVRFEVLV